MFFTLCGDGLKSRGADQTLQCASEQSHIELSQREARQPRNGQTDPVSRLRKAPVALQPYPAVSGSWLK